MTKKLNIKANHFWAGACPMSLWLFPFDRQHCSLLMESYSFNQDQVALLSSYVELQLQPEPGSTALSSWRATVSKNSWIRIRIRFFLRGWIRIRFVLRGWIRIRSISDRNRNPDCNPFVVSL